MPAAAAGGAPIPPGPPPPSCVSRTYAEGSTGACVTRIQQDVNAANFSANRYAPITVDGTYGPATRAAVAKFQAGCNTIEDFHAGSAGYMSGGGAGSNTWTALITHCYVPPV